MPTDAQVEAALWEWRNNSALEMPARFKRALEAAEAAAWLPIESAPRDCFILLYCPEDESMWWAKWQGTGWYGVDEMGLTRAGIGPDHMARWRITHWRPLPAPPRREER